MPDQIAELLHELIVATRIMANEKVLDAFGHVSVRHPGDPKRYFIPRHRAPELAEISDIVELNLDSEPIKPTGVWSKFRLHCVWLRWAGSVGLARLASLRPW